MKLTKKHLRYITKYRLKYGGVCSCGHQRLEKRNDKKYTFGLRRYFCAILLSVKASIPASVRDIIRRIKNKS